MEKIEEKEYTVKQNGDIELKVMTVVVDDDGSKYPPKNWRTTITCGDWGKASEHGLSDKLTRDWTDELIAKRSEDSE